MSGEIILYDVPSVEPCRSWSGNVWKTRLALNFKGIPYRTEWIPYIRLQETLKSFGIEPNPPGSWSAWSVPTVRFPDGKFVMDSAAIAVELEARYPNPPLKLNAELEKEAENAMSQVFMPMAPFLISFAPRVVAPEDLEWWKADRAVRFGMTVEDVFETERDATPFLEAARPGFEKCAEVLRAHKRDDGPFLSGSQPCYADFYFAATMHMFSRIGGQFLEDFMEAAPQELKELHEACKKWTVRQN